MDKLSYYSHKRLFLLSKNSIRACVTSIETSILPQAVLNTFIRVMKSSSATSIFESLLTCIDPARVSVSEETKSVYRLTSSDFGCPFKNSICSSFAICITFSTSFLTPVSYPRAAKRFFKSKSLLATE